MKVGLGLLFVYVGYYGIGGGVGSGIQWAEIRDGG